MVSSLQNHRMIKDRDGRTKWKQFEYSLPTVTGTSGNYYGGN
jgi:hypothetical protein